MKRVVIFNYSNRNWLCWMVSFDRFQLKQHERGDGGGRHGPQFLLPHCFTFCHFFCL